MQKIPIYEEGNHIFMLKIAGASTLGETRESSTNIVV